MKAEKIRNLTDVELRHQERDLARPALQAEVPDEYGTDREPKKIRGLRQDIARVQTVLREQELAAVKAETHKTETGRTQTSKVQTSKAEKR